MASAVVKNASLGSAGGSAFGPVGVGLDGFRWSCSRFGRWRLRRRGLLSGLAGLQFPKLGLEPFAAFLHLRVGGRWRRRGSQQGIPHLPQQGGMAGVGHLPQQLGDLGKLPERIGPGGRQFTRSRAESGRQTGGGSRCHRGRRFHHRRW